MAEVMNGIHYYLHLSDSTVKKSKLPHGVTFENDTLIFNNEQPINFELVVELENKPRNICCVIEKNANVELIETRLIQNNLLYQRTLEVKENATLAILILNESLSQANVKEINYVHQNAHIESAYAELSLSDVEGKYEYQLIGEQAYAEIKIAALSSESFDKKIRISLVHLKPHTYGRMSNYGVVKDHGKLCFDGVGKIEKGNYQSETHQTSKIMVFDQGCKAQANPYLYIDEYDVKASHAAGVGKMDEEHLFYLQSRGLNKHQAMQLITYGYLMPVVDVIQNETVKQTFVQTLERRMGD